MALKAVCPFDRNSEAWRDCLWFVFHEAANGLLGWEYGGMEQGSEEYLMTQAAAKEAAEHIKKLAITKERVFERRLRRTKAKNK